MVCLDEKKTTFYMKMLYIQHKFILKPHYIKLKFTMNIVQSNVKIY